MVEAQLEKYQTADREADKAQQLPCDYFLHQR